jgi:UDP-GlcNAc:undecaprenyl-phosphate GlcNAc-1-phosphate transferase
VSEHDALSASVGLFLAVVATWVFAGLARRTGWTDDGSDAPERKPQRAPVPLVGGIVLLLVLPMTGWQAMHEDRAGIGDVLRLDGAHGWALIGAVLVGLVDDLAATGLRPVFKLAGQCAVAALCARAGWEAEPAGSTEGALLTGLVALVAMNAFNTFDNADGAATSLGALGLGVVSPVLAAPLLGFLPFNLWIRRRTPSGGSTPFAYLGDAGSHLLGVLVALVPAAWPVLALPLFDLARLAVVRLRRGSRPWIGDRRHLAHRLQARGLGPTAVAAALLVVAAPSVAGGALAASHAWALPAGLTITALLFLAALRLTPDLP